MRRTVTSASRGWAPSRTRSIPVLGTPWTTLAAVLLVGLVAQVALPAHVAATVLNPMGASVAVAAVAGIRRSVHRVAWNLIAAGAAAYAVADVVGLLSAIAGAQTVASGLFTISYAAIAGGFAAFITRRR